MTEVTKQLSNKFNDSGVKMFQLLELLYQGDAYFKDAINIFMDKDKTSANNANVNLCKYLNSLKVFGIRVEKIKDKYHAYNLPYTYNFSQEELEAMQKLKNCSDLVLTEKTKRNFDKFINALEIRYDDETQQIAAKLRNDNENLDFSFFFLNIKDKIAECEKYISDNQVLEIVYRENARTERKVCGKPIEVNFGKRKAFIRIYNSRNSRIYDIPLNNIRSVIQSPQKSGMPIANTTAIVFKLKGRLAQNYKLRPHEICKGTDSKGNLIIVNQNEDITELLQRLMRYGTNCIVCTPAAVKEQMKDLLDKTIANYS